MRAGAVRKLFLRRSCSTPVREARQLEWERSLRRLWNTALVQRKWARAMGGVGGLPKACVEINELTALRASAHVTGARDCPAYSELEDWYSNIWIVPLRATAITMHVADCKRCLRRKTSIALEQLCAFDVLDGKYRLLQRGGQGVGSQLWLAERIGSDKVVPVVVVDQSIEWRGWFQILDQGIDDATGLRYMVTPEVEPTPDVFADWHRRVTYPPERPSTWRDVTKGLLVGLGLSLGICATTATLSEPRASQFVVGSIIVDALVTGILLFFVARDVYLGAQRTSSDRTRAASLS